MEDVQLKLDENGDGLFFFLDGEKQVAKMEVNVTGAVLTVFHTEVIPEAEGKGWAKKLLAAMVDYARKNALRVVPLCPYVHGQFLRRPAEYADVWDGNS